MVAPVVGGHGVVDVAEASSKLRAILAIVVPLQGRLVTVATVPDGLIIVAITSPI